MVLPELRNYFHINYIISHSLPFLNLQKTIMDAPTREESQRKRTNKEEEMDKKRSAFYVLVVVFCWGNWYVLTWLLVQLKSICINTILFIINLFLYLKKYQQSARFNWFEEDYCKEMLMIFSAFKRCRISAFCHCLLRTATPPESTYN